MKAAIELEHHTDAIAPILQFDPVPSNGGGSDTIAAEQASTGAVDGAAASISAVTPMGAVAPGSGPAFGVWPRRGNKPTAARRRSADKVVHSSTTPAKEK